MVRVIDDPEVPFVCFMDTEWIQKITVKGKPLPGASRFTIYLQTGPGDEPDEIAFVLDARFNYGDCQRRMVTNCKKEGCWLTEEDRDAPFLLNEEEDFKIKILVDDDSFKVKINGEDVLEYEQKLSDKTINCIRIQNDVQLTKVKLA